MEKFKNIGLFLMPTAIGVAVLAVMAYPKAKEYYHKLID